jgi:hypothetical protein
MRDKRERERSRTLSISIVFSYSCEKYSNIVTNKPHLLLKADASALAIFSRQFGQKYDSISSMTQN